MGDLPPLRPVRRPRLRRSRTDRLPRPAAQHPRPHRPHHRPTRHPHGAVEGNVARARRPAQADPRRPARPGHRARHLHPPRHTHPAAAKATGPNRNGRPAPVPRFPARRPTGVWFPAPPRYRGGTASGGTAPQDGPPRPVQGLHAILNTDRFPPRPRHPRHPPRDIRTTRATGHTHTECLKSSDNYRESKTLCTRS